MSLRNSVSRSLQCPNFRTQLLNSFISLAAPGSRVNPSWPRSTRHIQRASYSTTLVRRDNERPAGVPDDGAHGSDDMLKNSPKEIESTLHQEEENTPLEELAKQATLQEEENSPLEEEESTLNQEEENALLEEESTLQEEENALLEEESELQEEENSPLEEESTLNQENEKETASPPTNVPWYLQVDQPIVEQSHPLSERQRLPPLPEYSPKILQPILEHISIELGMDDLSLLDLRALDPPPALGANLLMIIGTARSEKHLHVSADRFCRWLRSTHNLTPFADGLLGRNELKLKLRRKAKRTRMLSAVGAKETGSGDIDDGIRTGWVCVNVGRVEGGIHPEQQEKQARNIENFVGFGTQTSACNIVVQIMTDEKRGQMDLETLWRGILRRSIKAQQDGTDEDVEEEVYDQNIEEEQHVQDLETKKVDEDVLSLPDRTVAYQPMPTRLRGSMARRERAYHTSAILRQLPDPSVFSS